MVDVAPEPGQVAGSCWSVMKTWKRNPVVDPAAQQLRFEKKYRALTATNSAYRTNQVPNDAIARRIRVECGPYDSTFDFAIANGHVVQLVQCWSFQLPDQASLA
jgi:hypothetical protein